MTATMKRMAVLGAAVALGSLTSTPAITITPSNDPQPDENILFNGTGLASGPATTVQGISNTSDFIVNFTSGETLTTPSQGAARIQGPFNDLTISLADPAGSFGSLILNLDAVADGTVQFTVNFLGGSSLVSSAFDVDDRGQNFFTLLAGSGERITSVEVEGTVNFADVQQIRIGGLGTTTTNVPDGGTTAALLGLGILGLAGLRQKLK